MPYTKENISTTTGVGDPNILHIEWAWALIGRLRIKQVRLAELLGIRVDAMSKLMTGRAEWGGATVMRLCELAGVTTHEQRGRGPWAGTDWAPKLPADRGLGNE
jgi:hypothetical protein